MISLVASFIQFITQTFNIVLFVVTLVGKVIFNILTTTTTNIFKIADNVFLFARIVYEDNVCLFMEDLPNFVNDLFENITYQFVQVQSGFGNIITDLFYRSTLIVSAFKWLIITLLSSISLVLEISKNAVILVGDSIWMTITFIPLQLPILLKPALTKLVDIVVGVVANAYLALLKITNFLTDVPLQSFTGIISAIVITRLVIHFKEEIHANIVILYWLFVRKCLYLYYSAYNYMVDSDVQVITHLAGAEDVGSSEIRFDPGIDEAADALCIICQERQKCVLTLPCRHVCLCTECCMRLYGYQRTCPICRTFIYHSVTVYL